MKHRVSKIAAILAVLLLAACNGVSSQSARDGGSPVLSRIRADGVLRVGMSGAQPPFNVLARSGEIIGLEADLAGALAESIGVRLEVVQRPFGQLLTALENGDVDMVMSGMTMTPRRNTRVAFAGPYFVSGKAILTSSDQLAAADEADDINAPAISLAALDGSTSADFIRESVPEAKLVTTTDYDEAVAMVIDGKVDAMVSDLAACVLAMLRNPNKGLQTAASPFTFEPLGVALPAEDPLLMNLVQNYMNMLEGTGLMLPLKAKWFVDGSWLSELPDTSM